MTDRISFQGEPGANSHLAAREAFPDLEPMPCASFEDAFAAVIEGSARYAMIPVENSVAGRVADVHHLIPESGLYIIGERFVPIRHQLLGLKDATLAGLTHVRSHPQALGQCRKELRALGVTAVKTADTAGAAREIAELGDARVGALASTLAGEIYGLKVLKADIADAPHNTTRFLVFSREEQNAALGAGPCMTSFIFRVRNVPAALFKAMGGFATNGVNMTKLESYLEGGGFSAAMFYAEIEGHPEENHVKLALEELAFFSSSLTMLGVYPADPFRRA
ncbi:prephenate dehydratase [Terricaulis silvestris]|uniref:prephenate dehydratase n=1 Tax=Terricaulis silvestris TaxID=2686094 RepID=A0A6I6MRG9_9CAUL|nr:prephenate dehydratase [Terricaulis silvestris]QGZ96026.1 P-protein [Terricaulis silvestris]